MKHNIFEIITHFELGGAETVAKNIALSKSNKFQYHLVAVANTHSDYSRNFINNMESQGVICHKPAWSNNKLSIILFPFYFVSLYLKYRPSVIHSHTETPDLSLYIFSCLFGWLSGWKRVKIVRTIHNTKLWSDWEWIGRRVEKFFIKRKANISISKAVEANYKKVYGEDTPIIYNGIEEQAQKPFEKIVPGKINILFAGRFEPQKGIDELVAVLRHYKKDSRFFFHVVGSGSMQQKVEETIGEMDNAQLYDRIYNLPVYYGSFDYLFMPSNFEGLGLTCVEASFARTPTIINGSCPGLNETLPKDWKLQVKHNNVTDFISIFNGLVGMNNAELSEEAYSFVKQRFSLKSMQEAYEKLYDPSN